MSEAPATAPGPSSQGPIASAGAVGRSVPDFSAGDEGLSVSEASLPGASTGGPSTEAEPVGPAAEGVAPAADAPEGASARLPAESIQTVVHWNLGRFRGCYQQALLRHPGLEGRVAVRFVVDASGNVTDALVAESDVPEPVSWCILSGFKQLRFPATDGRKIAVVYPFRLTHTGLVEAAPSSTPNAPTPRAWRSTGTKPRNVGRVPSGRAGVEALFALFLEGANAGPATVSAEPRAEASALSAGGSAPRTDRVEPDVHATPSGASAAPGCHAGDPLCSDIGR